MTSITLLLTDFQRQTNGGSRITLAKSNPGAASRTKSEEESEEVLTKDTNYIITSGDMSVMKRTNPHEDSLYGITNLISEVYMRGRYNNIIVLSLDNKNDTFDNINIASADDTFDKIDAQYTKQYSVLYINIIPRQIYLHQGEMGGRLAEDACDVLKRYGFINIGCRIHDIIIPKFVLIRANEIGSMGITENFKEFW